MSFQKNFPGVIPRTPTAGGSEPLRHIPSPACGRAQGASAPVLRLKPRSPSTFQPWLCPCGTLFRENVRWVICRVCTVSLAWQCVNGLLTQPMSVGIQAKWLDQRGNAISYPTFGIVTSWLRRQEGGLRPVVQSNPASCTVKVSV